MNNALLYLGVFLVVVLGALFAAPVFVDWNRYRDVVEAEASRLVGQEVRLGGPIEVRLLPFPTMRFEKVRIAAADVRSSEPLLRAETFKIWLAVGPLLKGAIEANDIELSRPVVYLQQDGQGGGSWQALTRRGEGMRSYVSNVALQAVKVTEGTLVVAGADGAERVRIDGINGDLSAPALEGPYRAKAKFNWQGSARELRFSTATPDPDGRVRLKASVEIPDSGSSWAVEGVVTDPVGRPQVSGELTARLPLRGAAKGQSFELRSQFTGNSDGFVLDTLNLAFEQEGRPQLLTGRLGTSWRGETRTQAALSAKWLDLDRLGAGADRQGAIGTLHALVERLVELFPEAGSGTGDLTIDQATIGGEVVSGLSMRVSRSPAGLVLERLEAGLPGHSRIEVAGKLAGGRTLGLDGDLVLRGASLSRFLAWFGHGAALSELPSDGAFALRAGVSLADRSLRLENAQAELAGALVGGALRYDFGDRRELDLDLECRVLDLEAWRGGSLGLLDGPEIVSRLAAVDTRARIYIGQLVAGTHRLRDVALDATLKSGRLDLRNLRLDGDAGLHVSVAGELRDLGGAAKGRLAGVLAADTPDGAKSLRELIIGSALTASGPLGDVAPLAPFRLAGVLAVGERRGGSVDLQLDGAIRKSTLELYASAEGRPALWNRSPLDVRGKLVGPDVTALARWLTGAQGPGSEATGTLSFKAAGTGGSRLQSLVALAADAGTLTYTGSATWAEAGPEWDGVVDVESRDAAGMLRLLGLGRPRPSAPAAIAGRIALHTSKDRVRVEPRALAIGGARVDGALELAGPSGARRIGGRIHASRATAFGLLDELTARRATGAAEVGEPAAVWPDGIFDLSRLDGVSGTVAAHADRLEVTEAVGVHSLVAKIELGAGTLSVTGIQGSALGGALGGELRLLRVPGGASLEGNLAIKGADLRHLGSTAGGATMATGQGDLTFSFKGRGPSPRGLVTALTGNGRLDHGAITLAGLGAAGLAQVVAERVAIRTQEAVPGRPVEPLADVILDRIGQSPVAFAAGRLEFALGDGALKAQPLTQESAEGRLSTVTTVDLGSLKFDSEWRYEPRLPAPRKGAAGTLLPAATAVYTGALGDWAHVTGKLDASALERELAVIRMEREVEELERLRRQDEERQRELERLRAQERRDADHVPEAPPGVRPGSDAGQGLPAAPSASPPVPGQSGWTPSLQTGSNPAPATGPGQPPDAPGAAAAVPPPAEMKRRPPPAPRPATRPPTVFEKLFGVQ